MCILCIYRLLRINITLGFIWNSWNVDSPCSFIGPSSLYQRWNLHIRHRYQLLYDNNNNNNHHHLDGNNNNNNNKNSHHGNKNDNIEDIIKIVFIIRKETKNDWGSYRTSRIILNMDDIQKNLNEIIKEIILRYNLKVMIDYIDLSILSFEEQVVMMSQTSMLIGRSIHYHMKCH